VIWNVGTGQHLSVITAPDLVFSASWNYDGSKLLYTCKDKKIRIINPRTGELYQEGDCHEGSKASRAIFLKSGLVFTTGFNRASERQYTLRAPDALNDPIVMVDLDTSNGVMFPFYDADTNMVYLCGKVNAV
jgi:coronin-1B/1C/6